MKRVFQILKKRKKSQVDLARYCGVTRAAVSNWKGGGEISAAHARAIVAFFGGAVTFDDIYGTRKRKASGE